MKKYLYAFKLWFLSAFHYRFNALASLLLSNLNLLATLAFWRLIYAGDTARVLNGFTLPGIVTYFLTGSVFRAFVYNSSGFSFAQLILSGQLGPLLTKPCSPLVNGYMRKLASALTGVLPQLALVAALAPLLGGWALWRFTPLTAPFLLAFLALSTLTCHLLWSLMEYMAFWLEEVNAIIWSIAVLLNLLSGLFLPLDFFPGWSVRVLELLPFASWGYIPSKICVGLYTPGQLAVLLAAQLFWVGALWALHRLVWAKGLKKYTSVGG